MDGKIEVIISMDKKIEKIIDKLDDASSEHNLFVSEMPGLGRLPSIDHRDRRFNAAQILEAEPAPTKRSILYNSGKSLNQWSTSQCTGFAGKKWLTMGPVFNRQKDVTPLMCYNGAQENDEWPGNDYDGSSVRGVMKWFQKQGFVREYRWAFDALTAANWLLAGKGPIIAGTDWHNSMFYPYLWSSPKAGGDEPWIDAKGPVAGGHAYVIDGVDLDKPCPNTSVRGAFRIKNSWGNSWGYNGSVWIRIDDMDRLIKSWGEAVMAVEVAR